MCVLSVGGGSSALVDMVEARRQLVEFIISFHLYIRSEGQIKSLGWHGQHLYLPSHPADPQAPFWFVFYLSF